ncbi:MAG: glycosyl hydrolase family 8, partial [Longimicrobiales bacterium]
RYRRDATAILADLWRLSTVAAGGRRFLLAGDKLCEGRSCRINVSYYAPYAYRIFATHDRQRPWRRLVDSSYAVLGAAASLTTTRLPPDWMLLDASTGRLSLGDRKDSAFSYDAFRVYWRVALDLELFGEPRASRYLKTTLPWLISHWERWGAFPAIVSSGGEDLAHYEATEMLAALGPAIRPLRTDISTAIERKLRANYKNGIWADNAGDQDSYYLQNWAWFGTALYERYLAPFTTAGRGPGDS